MRRRVAVTSCFRLVLNGHVSTGRPALLSRLIDFFDTHARHLVNFFVINRAVIIVHSAVRASHQTARAVVEATLAVGAMHDAVGVDRTIHAKGKILPPSECGEVGGEMYCRGRSNVRMCVVLGYAL